jgi:hypothetical protein
MGCKSRESFIITPASKPSQSVREYLVNVTRHSNPLLVHFVQNIYT